MDWENERCQEPRHIRNPTRSSSKYDWRREGNLVVHPTTCLSLSSLWLTRNSHSERDSSGCTRHSRLKVSPFRLSTDLQRQDPSLSVRPPFRCSARSQRSTLSTQTLPDPPLTRLLPHPERWIVCNWLSALGSVPCIIQVLNTPQKNILLHLAWIPPALMALQLPLAAWKQALVRLRYLHR